MRRAYVALVLSLVSWGVSVTVADAALDVLSAADLLVAEIAIGTLFVGLALLVLRRPVRAPWRSAALLGALEPAGAYLLANLGLARTSAAAGSLLISLESVFAVALAWLFLRERLSRRETLAIGLGLAGATLVALTQQGGESGVLGNLLLVLSSLAAGGYVVLARRHAIGVDPLSLVFKQGVASLLMVLPFAAASWAGDGSRLVGATAGTWALAVLAGLVGFAIPFTLWSYGASQVRPGVAAAGLNLIPVVGVLSAAVFGRGLPTTAQLMGGLVILAGLALLSRTPRDAEVALSVGPLAPDPVPCPSR